MLRTRAALASPHGQPHRVWCGTLFGLVIAWGELRVERRALKPEDIFDGRSNETRKLVRRYLS